MTDIEQQPELKTEMNTATDPDAQPTWDANTDLSGLKGVTIPSTAPSFNEDPRRDAIGRPTMRFRLTMTVCAIFSRRLTPYPRCGMVPVPFPTPCLRPRSSNSRRPSLNRAHSGSLCNSQLPRKPLHHNL